MPANSPNDFMVSHKVITTLKSTMKKILRDDHFKKTGWKGKV